MMTVDLLSQSPILDGKQYRGMNNYPPDIEVLDLADNADDAVAKLSVVMNMIEGGQSIVCVKHLLFLSYNFFFDRHKEIIKKNCFQDLLSDEKRLENFIILHTNLICECVLQFSHTSSTFVQDTKISSHFSIITIISDKNYKKLKFKTSLLCFFTILFVFNYLTFKNIYTCMCYLYGVLKSVYI